MPPGDPSTQEIVDRIASQQTIQRASIPEDLAGTLSFLVSDDASFMTGRFSMWTVDGRGVARITQ